MNCVNLRVRSKKYQKYFYCTELKKEVSCEECRNCQCKEFKKVKAIRGKKHEQTKKTDIKSSVKLNVWIRDGQKCIFCGKLVPSSCANAHFIPRSAGGLGIEKNIVTACPNCHHEQDNGLNTQEYDTKAEEYLKSIYNGNWTKDELIYKKRRICMLDGWISLHRKFIEWEWYTDANTMRLFLHLLLKANHEGNKWQGILVERGQLITSLKHLSKELKLSIQQIRTSLKKLKQTNEITIKSTSKYTLISIVKYDAYQSNDKKITNTITHNVTNEQQTNNKQITTNNNDNNIIIFINKYKGNPKNFGESLKIVRAAREDSEWNSFTSDEQMTITNRLMEVVR